MRPMLTLALATGLAAICQLQSGAAAPGLAQPTQAASQTKCGIAGQAVSSGNPAAPSAARTCGERLDWRLSQHGPGFWASDPAASAPAGATGASPPTVLRAPPLQAPANVPGCMNYQVMEVIGGEPREATVVACPEPDGSWQVTQYTPGLPPQVYTMPAPPAGDASPNEYASPDYDQYWNWGWAGAPWFWGFAPAIVVVPGFNHFHTFRRGFAHGFSHGFAHGFAHGSAPGFQHGFAHGFDHGSRQGLAPGFAHGFSRGFAHGFGHGVAAGHGGFAGMHR